jgi:hypothetical protein
MRFVAASNYTYKCCKDGRTAGQITNKAVTVKDTISSHEYVVIEPSTSGPAIVINKSDIHDFPTLYITSAGYAYGRFDTQCITLHSHIIGRVPDGHSIDHINWQKTDNRRENLRISTMTQQNANRATRKDKKPPHPELLKIGIYRLPRRMRWDKGQTKFVIDLSTGMISGTKAYGISIVKKFHDALLKLIAIQDSTDDSFIEERVRLANEYQQIVEAAKIVIPTLSTGDILLDLDDLKGEKAYCRKCLDILQTKRMP